MQPDRPISHGAPAAHRTQRWLRWLPGLVMLRAYQASWLPKDLAAGLVLTTMLVPVGIAYAEASGVPGVYGLYATIIPLLAYACFGPSRILVLGPDSALAAPILAVVVSIAAGDPSQVVRHILGDPFQGLTLVLAERERGVAVRPDELTVRLDPDRVTEGLGELGQALGEILVRGAHCSEDIQASAGILAGIVRILEIVAAVVAVRVHQPAGPKAVVKDLHVDDGVAAQIKFDPSVLELALEHRDIELLQAVADEDGVTDKVNHLLSDLFERGSGRDHLIRNVMHRRARGRDRDPGVHVRGEALHCTISGRANEA